MGFCFQLIRGSATGQAQADLVFLTCNQPLIFLPKEIVTLVGFPSVQSFEKLLVLGRSAIVHGVHQPGEGSVVHFKGKGLVFERVFLHIQGRDPAAGIGIVIDVPAEASAIVYARARHARSPASARPSSGCMKAGT